MRLMKNEGGILCSSLSLKPLQLDQTVTAHFFYSGVSRINDRETNKVVIQPRASIGTYFNPRGPTYSARGRIKRLFLYCSNT